MYIPLGIKTSYSLLDSTVRINKLVEFLTKNNFLGAGFIDNHNLFGAMEFNEKFINSSLKPITGCEVKLENEKSIMIYCKNSEGYKNLCFLLSKSYENDLKNPFIYWSDLENLMKSKLEIVKSKPEKELSLEKLNLDDKHSKANNSIHCEVDLERNIERNSELGKVDLGLMAIAVPSEICEVNDIESCALKMEKYFNGSWCVGIRDRQENEFLVCKMSDLHKTPVVAIPKVNYIKKDDDEAYEALKCIKNGTYLESGFFNDFYLQTQEELEEIFHDWKEPLENTLLFAKKCSFILEKKKPELPKYTDNENECLREQAIEGIEKKGITKLENSQEYVDRLNFELGVIIKMNFSGYFLIVADFINWAKKNGVSVGPGRGSGAGSLVAYAIGITDVDPLQFGLVFERFLNPGRVSMPDFDVDFCPKGRAKVINYIVNKYGKDHVAHIVTFGSLQSKGVLRDVGRILQIPYPVIDRLCKAIPSIQGFNVTLEKFMENNADLEKQMKSNPNIKKLFDLSLRLEGLFRHASIHAAGIVIGSKPLHEMLPLLFDEHTAVTQFSLNYIETAGLVKFDLLGLTTLTIISKTLDVISDRRSGECDLGDVHSSVGSVSENMLDISKIPLEDDKTLDMLSKGHTVGIFQFESKGMKEVLVGLKPESFKDLIAVISLYRPGPMENIPKFIKGKHKEIKIEYLYSEMEKILESTYGVFVYQEQVLQVARDLAGYSMQEADLLRRAMGKKKPEEMARHQKEFIKRVCENTKSTKQKAEDLFNQIVNFAKYAFPKAHATPYALISYQTAYLKANYTIEFMTASMILEQQNTEKLAELIYETKRMGIKILKPNINKSERDFKVENDTTISFGLSAIKNVSGSCIEEVISKKPFVNMQDFYDRASINKKTMESFIKAGAFDDLERNRAKIFNEFNSEKVKKRKISLFEVIEDDIQKWTEEEEANYEFEVIGSYIDHHPLHKINPNNFGIKWISTRPTKEEDVEAVGLLENLITKKSQRNKIYKIGIVSDPCGMWRFIANDSAELAALHKKMVWISMQDKGKFLSVKNIYPLSEKLKRISRINVKIKSEQDLLNVSKKLKEHIISPSVSKDTVDSYDEIYKKPSGIELMLRFEQQPPLKIGYVNWSDSLMNSIKDIDWEAEF
ncbi:DNA polymerase III subunit alpha [Candidatus Nesciobacter abundans]|uniref:DNA polymerase III subunit alpha n=1 Tax=Candidatus Nesciobacter abundans TaxID=2601668 RepID=A0A5C0UGB0_9PROT|nr:DNA polymerase III subunit alpha [Candidatus Nesciobacter abundans]QEK39146.1 DNA polymerase III subunit alpha [Candidatus Nesciobacter abundans]